MLWRDRDKGYDCGLDESFLFFADSPHFYNVNNIAVVSCLPSRLCVTFKKCIFKAVYSKKSIKSVLISWLIAKNLYTKNLHPDAWVFFRANCVVAKYECNWSQVWGNNPKSKVSCIEGARCFYQSASGYHAWKGRHNVILLKSALSERWGNRDKTGKGRRRKDREIRDHEHGGTKALQFKGLIPGGVEAALYGLGLLFTLTARIWDQFELHVGVWQTIGVHRHQVPALFDLGRLKNKTRRLKSGREEKREKNLRFCFICI